MKRILLSISALAISALSFAQQASTAGNLPTSTGKGFEFMFKGYGSSSCLGDVDGALPVDSVISTEGNSVWGDLYGGGTDAVNVKLAFYPSADTAVPSAVELQFDGTQESGLFALRFPKADCGYGSRTVDLSDSASRNLYIAIEASEEAKISVFPFWQSSKGSLKGYADKAADRATFNLRKGVNHIYGWMADSTWNHIKADLTLTAGIAFLLDDATQAVNLKLMNIKLGDAAPLEAPIGSLTTIQKGDEIVAGLSDSEVAKLALNVYPNPSSDKVTVSYASQAGKSVSVVLSNGVSTVSTVKGGETSAELNVAGLASGIYFASVYVDGAYASTTKVSVK